MPHFFHKVSSLDEDFKWLTSGRLHSQISNYFHYCCGILTIYILIWNIWVKIILSVLMENMVIVKSEEQVTYWRQSCNKSNKSIQWRQLRTEVPQRHPSSYNIKSTLCCLTVRAPHVLVHPIYTIHEALPITEGSSIAS